MDLETTRTLISFWVVGIFALIFIGVAGFALATFFLKETKIKKQMAKPDEPVPRRFPTLPSEA